MFRSKKKLPPLPVSSRPLQDAVAGDEFLVVHQRKEWGEIILGFEARNTYEIVDSHQQQIGKVEEQGGGFWSVVKRLILRSHRALDIHVTDTRGEILFRLHRGFFFFFSDLFVESKEGIKLGSIHRRFGIINKKYTMLDQTGAEFAKVHSPIWRLWKFPLYVSHSVEPVGEITKKWSGAMREFFTDADVFKVDFGRHKWHPRHRAVILAAAISIDFDFFEENTSRSGLLDLGN